MDLLLTRWRRDVRVKASHRKLRHNDREPEQPVVLLDFLTEGLERGGVNVDRQEVWLRLGRDEGEPFLDVSTAKTKLRPHL